MSNVLVFVLELIGTAAFAVSGAIVGIKKQMDLFGVIVLGVCTAVGGGIVRDVILGVTPPATFHVPAARARPRRAARAGVRPAAAGDGRGRPGRVHGRRCPVRVPAGRA